MEVTDREAAIAVLRDAVTFTVDDPRFSTARVIGPSMLSRDGAEHDRHRAPFAAPFRKAEAHRRFEPFVARRAADLVAALAPAGRGELRTGLAAPLAADVMALVLGLESDRDRMLRWYDDIVASVDAVTEGGSPTAAGAVAFRDLSAAVTGAVATEGSLLADAAAHGGLTGAEIASNAAVLLFGGIVTVEGAIATALYHLLSRPDALALVRKDRSLVAAAVEESLRLEPAAAVVDRYATTDTDFCDHGDLVRVSLRAANRDPVAFPDPDRFDVRRPNAAQHLAFARGPHACLGIHLARLEARAALDAVLEGLPGVRLDAGRSTPPAGLIFRKPERVWATWDDAD